ncbi:MAG: hypothetical protein MUC59_07390 [Saprospiraceae bacterium]|nr:hypothetical protein [Saprospiraceae bacterium]
MSSKTSYPNGYINERIYKSNKKLEKLLAQAPVGYKGEFEPLLEDLQANVLKSHRRHYSGSLFLHFHNAQAALAWMERLPITSAKAQFDEQNQASPITCFYLSYKGYVALGLKHICPYVGNHPAFTEDIEDRIRMKLDSEEKDPNLHPRNGSSPQGIHAMLFVAHNDAAALENILAAYKAELGGVAYTSLQKGLMKYNDQNKVVEWFGFRDGLSQPQYFPDAAANKKNVVQKSSLTPLNSALIYDRGGDSLFSTGSFLAFLKLEQDVVAFNGMVDAVATAAGTTDKELAAAYILGRFRNGDPVTLHGKANAYAQSHPTNDFDYNSYVKANNGNRTEYLHDENGSRCPMHAHIRKANPRLEGQENNMQIVRRGILYDDRIGIKKSTQWQPDDAPSTGAGMLFMSFQSSLDKQFEYVMNQWIFNANNGRATTVSGVDMLVGAKDGINPDRWYVPTKWNSSNPNDKALVELKQGCIRLKGGAYFFAPSLSFLKRVSSKAMVLNLNLGTYLLRGSGTKPAAPQV